MVSVSNERSGNMLIATEHSLAALSRGYIDAARQGVNIESPVMAQAMFHTAWAQG